MKANGRVFKYGDNVDTDVIIPARYLNCEPGAEGGYHCGREKFWLRFFQGTCADRH